MFKRYRGRHRWWDVRYLHLNMWPGLEHVGKAYWTNPPNTMNPRKTRLV